MRSGPLVRGFMRRGTGIDGLVVCLWPHIAGHSLSDFSVSEYCSDPLQQVPIETSNWEFGMSSADSQHFRNFHWWTHLAVTCPASSSHMIAQTPCGHACYTYWHALDNATVTSRTKDNVVLHLFVCIALNLSGRHYFLM